MRCCSAGRPRDLRRLLADGSGGDPVHGLNRVPKYERVHVIGSLDLVQSLLRSGLVDTLHLWMYPLLLGTGKRVFEEGTVPTALRLTESQAYPGGAIHLTYEAAGTPTYGTMG